MVCGQSAQVHASSTKSETSRCRRDVLVSQANFDENAKERKTEAAAEPVVRDLRSVNLAGATLRGADFRGAGLGHANLSDADLRDADLRDADLTGADLRSADLRGADLRNASLRYAHLYNSDFTGAQLGDADLTYAKYDKTTICPGLTAGENSRSQRCWRVFGKQPARKRF